MAQDPTSLTFSKAVERAEQIEAGARELLDALDRQYGTLSLSHNVRLAMASLRDLLPREIDLDPADQADDPKSSPDA